MTAGWYVDPFARFEGRYFDGEKWTERVSHEGSLAIDGGWADFIANQPTETAPLTPAADTSDTGADVDTSAGVDVGGGTDGGDVSDVSGVGVAADVSGATSAVSDVVGSAVSDVSSAISGVVDEAVGAGRAVESSAPGQQGLSEDISVDIDDVQVRDLAATLKAGLDAELPRTDGVAGDSTDAALGVDLESESQMSSVQLGFDGGAEVVIDEAGVAGIDEVGNPVTVDGSDTDDLADISADIATTGAPQAGAAVAGAVGDGSRSASADIGDGSRSASADIGDSSRSASADIADSTRRMGLILAALAVVAVLAAWVLWALFGSKGSDPVKDTETASVEVQTPTSEDGAGSAVSEGMAGGDVAEGDAGSQDDTSLSDQGQGSSADSGSSSDDGGSGTSGPSAGADTSGADEGGADTGSAEPVVYEPKEIGDQRVINGEQLLLDLEKWSSSTSELDKADDTWGCWIRDQSAIDFAFCGPYRALDGVDVADVVPLNTNLEQDGVTVQSNTGAALRETQQFEPGVYIGKGTRELTVAQDGSRILYQETTEPTDNTDSNDADSSSGTSSGDSTSGDSSDSGKAEPDSTTDSRGTRGARESPSD